MNSLWDVLKDLKSKAGNRIRCYKKLQFPKKKKKLPKQILRVSDQADSLMALAGVGSFPLFKINNDCYIFIVLHFIRHTPAGHGYPPAAYIIVHIYLFPAPITWRLHTAG